MDLNVLGSSTDIKMEYDKYEEYELDENFEIEDFDETGDFFKDPIIELEQTKFEPEMHQAAHQQRAMKDFYEKKSAKDEIKILELETKYTDLLNKYNSLTEQFSKIEMKNKTSQREKIKQLEERVQLIKDKAKEKIAEKEDNINELHEKIKNYDEMLKVMEVNCKQAVLQFSEFQKEIAKKDELLQEHFSFKNRYDYTINFLTEKCKKITDTYERRIRTMQEKSRSEQVEETDCEQQMTEIGGLGERRQENISLTEAIEELDSTMEAAK